MSNRQSNKSIGHENSARATSKSTIRQGRRESQKGITSRGGPRSSKASGKGSRLNGAESGTVGSRSKLVVLDENGVDVTPRSMLQLKASAKDHGQQGTPGGSPPSSEASEVYTMERMSMSARFSRSDKTQDGSTSVHDVSSAAGSRPGHEPESEGDRNEVGRPATLPDENNFEVIPRTQLNEHGDDEICIRLCESDTFWLLNISGRCVASDAPEAIAVEEANGRYRALLKGRQGSELYANIGVQTVNNIVKAKEVQSFTEASTPQSSQTTGWEIHDALQASQVDEGVQDGGLTLMSTDERKKSSVQRSMRVDGLDPSANLELSGLDNAMATMEKVILQNVYHEKMLLYRDQQVALLSEGSKENEQEIIHLWNFSSPETEGRNVSCVAWNKLKPDLLAVGYGEFDFTNQRDGLVAFWSLKNPEHPEWTFSTPFGVTAIDFSSTNYNLLAVGLYDGTVAIYDVRAPTDKAILESGHGVPGKHSDPVWKVKWIKRGADRDETLVSISTDGRVTQWSLKKGLEYIDLMKLKRVARKTTVASGANNNSAPQTEAFISRRGSGTCFDFSSKDGSIYVTGTEDGMLHKCSCSYSEQYLESFFGHSGPIHQVKWSPFVSNVFVSASADWTIKLWKEDSTEPVLTFQSGNEQISDVCWSPTNSTVFASTSWDGRLEVWDLSISTLKPVTSIVSPGEKLSCLLFSDTSPVIVSGGQSGTVGVYRVVGMENPVGDTSGDRLLSAMASNF